MLARVSIRTKITIVVAFLLVAMAGIGVIAVRNMQALNANAVDIQSNWLPNIRVLGELQKNVIQYRSVIRAYLLADTMPAKDAVEKRYNGLRKVNAEIRAKYEKQIRSPEERALYDEWTRQWALFDKNSDTVRALSRKALGSVLKPLAVDWAE
jgi:methyl-accepting chemotaxis protein